MFDMFSLQLFIYEFTDDDGVDNGHRTAFRGCENPHPQTHNDSKGQNQCPDGFFKLRPYFLPGWPVAPGCNKPSFFRYDIIGDHKGNGDQYSRYVTCEEHVPDRYTCRRRIDDQSDSRRYDGCDTGGCRSDRRRITFCISSLLHFRHQHLALKGTIRAGGT